jgi:hypothetical protein
MLRTLTVFRPGPGCSHQRSGIEGCQQGTAQTEGMVRCLFVICILPQTVRILAAFFILADSQRSWVDLLWVLWKIPSIKDLANVSLYSLIRGQCVILYRSF